MKSRSFDGFQSPVAPRRGGGQTAAAQSEIEVEGRAAEVLIRAQRRVHVGDAVERVVAGHRVTEVRGNLRPLAVGRAQRRRHTGHHLRVALRPLARVIDSRRDDHLLARREQQGAADAGVVEVVHLAAGLDVGDGAPTLRARERQAAGELLAEERTRDRGLGLHEVEAAVVHFEVALGAEGRLARGDVDGARGGVLAKQRPLGTAQHLDALHVHEVERGRRRARVEHAVDVKAHARLDAVVGETERRAEAADVDRRVARVGRVELDGRDHFLQPVHVERAGLGHLPAADDRQRDRHVLRDLFTAASGHHDALGEAGWRQRQLHVQDLVGVERHAAHGGLETVERCLYAVGASNQRRGGVSAVTVGDELGRGTGLGHDLDHGSRNGPARRVLDHALHRSGALRKCARGSYQRQYRQNPEQLRNHDLETFPFSGAFVSATVCE